MGVTPNTPKYNQTAAINEQNRVNLAAANQQYADVYGPNGGYSVSVDPTTGQMTVNKVLSGNSQNAMNQQQSVLEQAYTYNPADAENAYYNAQMAYLQPQMQKQVTRSESALTNRGIPIGGSAWNDYMGDVYDAQNQRIASLGSNAVSAGQDYQNNLYNQASMLGGQVVDPSMVSGQAGAGYADMYDPQFQNEIAKYKTKMAGSNVNQQVLGGVGTVAGGIIGGIYGGGPAGAMLGATIGGAAGTGIGTAIDSY